MAYLAASQDGSRSFELFSGYGKPPPSDGGYRVPSLASAYTRSTPTWCATPHKLKAVVTLLHHNRYISSLVYTLERVIYCYHNVCPHLGRADVGQPSDPCRGLEAVVFFMSFLGTFVMLPKISFNVTKNICRILSVYCRFHFSQWWQMGTK